MNKGPGVGEKGEERGWREKKKLKKNLENWWNNILTNLFDESLGLGNFWLIIKV